MTDKEKLEKAVKLADAMYYAAQYLTTDASRLRKAMEDYHQFIIREYNKQEPASEDLEDAARKYKMRTPFQYPNELHPAYQGFKAGAKWQKEQMMKDAVEGELDCDDNGSWCSFDSNIVPISQAGNKVKLIIIKE